MSDFRFAIGDYANIPHFVNVQGVVHGVSDHIIDGKRYLLQWLVGAQTVTQWFTADDVAAANAPKDLPQASAAKGFTTETDPRTIAARVAEAIAFVAPRRKRKAPPRRKR